MKKYCKDIDITNWRTIYPFVKDCVYRHYKRHDFEKLLKQHGLTDKQYKLARIKHDKRYLLFAIGKIARHVAQMIYEGDLSELTPIHIRKRIDKTSFKERLIGSEGALQQILDFVAVGSAMPIFKRRIVDAQASSIPGRGQLYGMRKIKRWILKMKKREEYCARHHYHFTSLVKYSVKLDAEKCYPNMRMEYFMHQFRRDCGNQDIIWLWGHLLATHRVGTYQGFMIGSLLSQWAVQYCMSYAYRYAMSLHQSYRKDKKQVSHMMIFMDDMLLFGSNRRELLKAIEKIVKYMYSTFKIKIKPNYSIHEFADCEKVDMLGFSFYSSGKVAIRARNFIHIRRLALRYNRHRIIKLDSARRFVSYGGFIHYTDTIEADREYHAQRMLQISRTVISIHENKSERRAA